MNSQLWAFKIPFTDWAAKSFQIHFEWQNSIQQLKSYETHTMPDLNIWIMVCSDEPNYPTSLTLQKYGPRKILKHNLATHKSVKC